MALLNTYKLSARDQTFQADRYMHESILQEGVIGATDYKVTPGGASLQWSVAAGMAWVKGDDTTRQGLYPQVNDAAVTGTVAAGHATLPRVDAVILQIADSSITGVSDTPTLSTLAGTPTASAQITNFAGANYRAGAAAIPNTALHICDIAVPATHAGVLTTGMIVDRRRWARGAYHFITRNQNAAAGANYTTTSTTAVVVDATNLSPRIECSGAPLRLTLRGHGSHSVLAATWGLQFRMDGAQMTDQELRVASGGAGVASAFTLSWDVVPTAGSHILAPYYFAASTAGTVTLTANTGFALEFSVEELVRVNAANT